MPYGDRTGPEGSGPRTGRRLGYCSGYESPGFTRGRGMGSGQGSGRGRGFRFWRGREEPFQPRTDQYRTRFDPPDEDMVGPEEEEGIHLEKVLESLQREIDSVKERLKALKKR